jgi:hypothetical protein
MVFLRDVREIRVQKEDDTDLRNSLLKLQARSNAPLLL